MVLGPFGFSLHQGTAETPFAMRVMQTVLVTPTMVLEVSKMKGHVHRQTGDASREDELTHTGAYAALPAPCGVMPVS